MQDRSTDNGKTRDFRSSRINVNKKVGDESELLPAAGTRRVWRAGGLDFPFRWCPPGVFFMGEGSARKDKSKGVHDSAPKENSFNFGQNLFAGSFSDQVSNSFHGFIDETKHEVTLTRGFWMLEIPVTQIMYQTIMGVNPSRFRGRFHPVEAVTWYDASSCVNRASNLLKLKIVLPSEAQWEYACRAGASDSVYFNENLDERCWYIANSQGKTHKVGTKLPNDWGLHDMQGNVWEWCADWYCSYYNVPQIDPRGAYYGERRIYRGGSWLSGAQNCRPACRSSAVPVEFDDNIGFRFIVEQYVDSRISDYDEW